MDDVSKHFQHRLGLGQSRLCRDVRLPLVTSNLPTYREVFETYRCGAVYETLQGIPEILSALEADYAHHAQEARRYYDEQLDPREGLRNFRTALIKVCGRGDE